MDECDLLLEEGASALEVKLSECDRELLLQHLDAVLEANRQLNLTGPTTREEAVVRHTLDSLALLHILGEGALKLADLGSGAGFPGIPIGIVGGFEVHLIESIGKKAAFLRRVVRQLGRGIHAEVHAMRAEERALSEPGCYDVVTARAVTSLPALVELAAPLLRLGGLMLAMKGRPDVGELERGVLAAKAAGMCEVLQHPYELPIAEGGRLIVVYEKRSAPLVRLPRRAGKAQKRPLV